MCRLNMLNNKQVKGESERQIKIYTEIKTKKQNLQDAAKTVLRMINGYNKKRRRSQIYLILHLNELEKELSPVNRKNQIIKR